jgi:hypothetical protein
VANRRGSRLLSLHRAELAGQEAARQGKSISSCPHGRGRGASGQWREAWLRGFESDEVVSLYRLSDGELSVVSCRRGDLTLMLKGTWAAIATRDGEEIRVEMVYGDPRAMFQGSLLTDLVRGDMQG